MAESDSAGKPWEGMDWRDSGTREWWDGLTPEQLAEWNEWRDWHEQKAQEEERARDEREQQENDERLRREIEHEQKTGEIDAYRLAHGAPAPPTTTLGFVDLNGDPVDAVVKDQPIKIQVTRPLKPGQKPADSIEVTVTGPRLTFIGREYEGTDDVTLEWIGNTTGDPIYRSGPLTIEKGGEGVSDLGVPGFEFNIGGMGGFSVDDGDVVQVGFGGTAAGIQVFGSVAKLELALTLAAIGSAHQGYMTVIINLKSLEEQVLAGPDSPERAELLKQIGETRAKAEQVVKLANSAVRYVNTTDTLDHEKVAVARLYATWMGIFRQPTVGADGKRTTEFGPLFVPDPRDENDIMLDTSREAKEEVERIMWSGLAQATIGGYRLLAQATMVAQIMTLFGTNELGQRATGMERWMAFFDIVSQAALMGAMVKWNASTLTARNASLGVARTTPRIGRTQPVEEPTVAMSAPTGTPVIPEAAGMLRHAARDAQLVARKYDVSIQVRFTNPDALGPRAMGWTPKPMALKSKTITKVDREIGAPATAHDGTVGLFEPKLPDRTRYTDAEWKVIEARYNQRLGEWDGAIGAYQRKLVDQGKFTMRDGMMCDKDGTPITGDYDLFEIGYRDGTQVPLDVYDAVVGDLMSASGFQAAHGAHMRWNPKPLDDAYHLDFSGDLQAGLDAIAKWQADRSIFRAIVQRHQPGGEGLITFAPNQPPVITYAGEAVGPKLADLGIPMPSTPSATGSSVFVKPTLFVATTDQLLAGRYEDGANWQWMQGTDWQVDVDAWQTQWDNIQRPIVVTTMPTASTPLIVPPITAGQGGFNWRPIAIGGIVVGVLLLGGIAGFSFVNNQQPAPVAATATPTQPAVAQPTQPDVTVPPQVTDPPQATQTAQATRTSAPTQPPTDPPSPVLPPALGFTSESATQRVNEYTGGLVVPPDGWQMLDDAIGDQFTFDSGFPPPSESQTWADLVGAAGFLFDLDGSTVGDLSDRFACPPDEGSTYLVFCNQNQPLEAGRYALVLTAWQQPRPDPFPDLGICSWAIQTDVDGDPTTGFPDPPPGHPLIGSEIYIESLMFVGQDGELTHYLLGTDYRQPARPDTGDFQGNLPTIGRAVTERAVEDLPVNGRSYADLMMLVPADDLGDSFGVHAYCASDRNRLLDTVAVDAFGHPDNANYPEWDAFMTVP